MDFQTAETILQIVVAGILIGCIYGLMCIGLALIFGVMRIINFAQGDFLMLGMYSTLYGVVALSVIYTSPWSPFVAALLMSPVLYAFGNVVYRVMLSGISDRRRLSEESKHSAQLIITLGLALILQNLALIVFGTLPQTARTPLSASAWIVGPMFGDEVMLFVNKARAVSSLLAIVLAIGLFFVISRTRLGKSVRAAADDADAARYSGVNVRAIYRIVFGLGTAVTALAGGLAATFYPFHPYVGLEFVIIMYSGVVLGGLGSMLGAFWGGFTIGMVQQLSTLVLPQQLQNATIFVIFVLILLFRPQGLFGRQTERT